MSLEVKSGVKQIKWDYDTKMRKEIMYLSLKGIDVRKFDEVGTDIYKRFLEENSKNETLEQLSLSKIEASEVNNIFEEEINRIVTRRKLDSNVR